MDGAADGSNGQGAGAKLNADALKLINGLDSDIEDLRRLAPSEYGETIESLQEVIAAIRAAFK